MQKLLLLKVAGGPDAHSSIKSVSNINYESAHCKQHTEMQLLVQLRIAETQSKYGTASS